MCRGVAEAEPVIKSWTWWQSGGLQFGLGEHIDGLAVMMLLLVTFISTLVQIYSLEYVRGDRRYTHFFAALTLFTAGMLTMVLAENMVQLILGWEIMGLCSFMLIGHWWEEEANARAARQGVPHRARRRHRPARRHGDHVRRVAARSPSAGCIDMGQRSGHRPHGAAVGVGRAVHRLHRQERPVPAAHLAARRHGRPDARVSSLLHSLDDGRRRRVPRRPPLPGVPRRA